MGEREAFEHRMIEVYQQRDSYRVQAEQLLTLLEELANGHQHENNQNGKVHSSKPSFKNLERNIQEKRVSFEEKTKQFKNEDKEFEKQRAHFIGKRRKYAEDFAKVVPLKNGGAKIFELQQKIRSEPKKQKEILSKAGLTGTAFFEQVSQNALSDDEPIQLIRPPRSSTKRKRMEQPDKRATKRVEKEGEKKQKRKRSKKKKDDKKKDSGKVKRKIEGRTGTTPRPFVGDGNAKEGRKSLRKTQKEGRKSLPKIPKVLEPRRLNTKKKKKKKRRKKTPLRIRKRNVPSKI